EVNTAKVANVPQDWSDLLKPDYKGQVALAGDPTVSNQAISGVWAAALANGGSLDNAQPGLDFFKKLNDAGNFVPIIAKTAIVATAKAALPDTSGALLPTLDQITKATDVISKGWPTTVNVTVK